MSETTALKRIAVPSLSRADFGAAMLDQFANIDFNFQKLASLGINRGMAGKSCQYVTINLLAPFCWPASNINNATDTFDYNCFEIWANQELPKIKAELGDDWTELETALEQDYNQFYELTGADKYEYVRIACMLLWGKSTSFTSTEEVPDNDSLTGKIQSKFGDALGEFSYEIDGITKTYHGNWLYDIYCSYAYIDSSVHIPEKRAQILIDHLKLVVPGRIIVAVTPIDEGGEYMPVGSLEYWYIDPRFRNQDNERPGTGMTDASCVMHWEPDSASVNTNWRGRFDVLEIFPTIKLGDDGVYYWVINGLNTGVPVQGPKGADGKNAQILVVQRVENVLGYDPKLQPIGDKVVFPYYDKTGVNKIPITAFSGSSFRTRAGFEHSLIGLEGILPTYSNLEASPADANDRIRDYVLKNDSVSKAEAEKYSFLKNQIDDGWSIIDSAHIFRIYAEIGKDVFWTAPADKIEYACQKFGQKMENDFLNHEFDPSCDRYYFGQDGVSYPDPNDSLQAYIKSLDGAAAIVLPGPAHQWDRTDTVFWITTLRAVPYYKDESSKNFSWMLVAYCSPEEQITNSVDEHTQAGLMQHLDAYSYKSNGDNRNKPRGLMLPIGSAEANGAGDTSAMIYASHIIHADMGGFSNYVDTNNDVKNRRGIQTIPTNPYAKKISTYTGLITYTVDGKKYSEAQYREIIGKMVMHIGSINDYRALNLVPVDENGKLNGAVPGRESTAAETAYGQQAANYFGGYINTSTFNGAPRYLGYDYATPTSLTSNSPWFFGSELHIDEPVTITPYRDVKRKGRLLDVEGDVVIGTRIHKNMPGLRHNQRDGGLVVQSTITGETGRDRMIHEQSIFAPEWYNGIKFSIMPYMRRLAQNGQSWQSNVGRWKNQDDSYRGLYSSDNNTINPELVANTMQESALFSILADDTIGARAVAAMDGIVIYNPTSPWTDDDDNQQCTNFSVDAMGNIQTMGEEVRSNAVNTAWYLHTRWNQDEISYPIFNVPQSWIPMNGTNPATFRTPKHNQLLFGTDHEYQFPNTIAKNKDGVDATKMFRWWRASNWATDEDIENLNNAGIELWGGFHNTDICRLPAGYIINVGSIRSDSGHHKTFSQPDERSSFGNTWGTSELMPTIQYVSYDHSHLDGTLSVAGINCMAIDSPYDDLITEKIRARYGLQVAHGAIIDSARGPIYSLAPDSPRMTENDYEGDKLSIVYESRALDDGYADFEKWKGLGDKPNGRLIELFDATKQFRSTTPIGLWLRTGMFVEDSVVINKDLVVNRVATIAGQVRAKSFRRHRCSEDYNSNWSFMLDNGMSSIYALKKSTSDTTFIPKKLIKTNPSPLYIDYGEMFGLNRLLRFGWSKNVDVNSDGDVVYSESKDEDHNLCLIAELPFKNLKKVSNGTLFGKYGKLPYTATFVSLQGICILNISLDVNLIHSSRDKNKKGWFGRHRHVMAYGISDNATNGQNDWGTTWCKHEDGSKGQSGKAINAAGNNKCTEHVTQFNLQNMLGDDWSECAPQQDLYFFMGSLYAGWSDCNWNTEGTDSDRSQQKGCWFKLRASDGKLTIPYWSECGALFATRHTINMTFSWIGNVAEQTYKYRYCITKNSDTTPNKNITTASGNITSLSDWLDDPKIPASMTLSTTNKCLWQQIKEIANTSREEIYDWVLVEEFEEEPAISYWKSNSANKSTDEDGNEAFDSPISPVEITGTDLSNLIDAINNDDTAKFKSLCIGDVRYLWEKSTTSTEISWNCIYNLDESEVGGKAAQSISWWDTSDKTIDNCFNNTSINKWVNDSPAIKEFIDQDFNGIEPVTILSGNGCTVIIYNESNVLKFHCDIWAMDCRTNKATSVGALTTWNETKIPGKFQLCFDLTKSGSSTTILNITYYGFQQYIH